MYTPKREDGGILFTALSEYLNALEKDIPVIKEAIKYSENYKMLLKNHEETIKRVRKILEEL